MYDMDLTSLDEKKENKELRKVRLRANSNIYIILKTRTVLFVYMKMK